MGAWHDNVAFVVLKNFSTQKMLKCTPLPPNSRVLAMPLLKWHNTAWQIESHKMSITDQIARLMFNHKHPEALVPPSILNFNPIASCNCISQHVWHDSSWPFKTINNKSPGKQQHKPTTCWQKNWKVYQISYSFTEIFLKKSRLKHQPRMPWNLGNTV